MTLRRALFGFIAASCLFLLVEMIDSHLEVENPVTWVPVAATSLATAVSLVAFLQWRERRWRLALQGVSVLLISVGVLGFFLHTKGDFSPNLEARRSVPTEGDGSLLYAGSLGATQGGQASDGEERAEEGEEDEDEGKAPPLAPLSLAGVGILSLMAASLRGEPAKEDGLGRA